jgi:serine/threonine-protein kinase
VLGGKFAITGVLGDGGTGIVYAARRLAHGDEIALKVMHPHLAGDKQIRGRFTREATILRRLEGRHLCPILDFGELPDPRVDRLPGVGLLYLALPKIDGHSLEAILKAEGPLPPDRAIDLLLQVCEALQEAHAQGVIHRDLKPGNVLVRNDQHVVVVDFGMAKIVTGGGTGTTALTQHNMVFGTPEYMAPEQARGDELDARCDVYAAGIILYELLTGAVPFTGGTTLNVLTAQMTAEPKPPRARAPERGIGEALEAVTLHALAKDPGHRYATAAALASALRLARSSPDDASAVQPVLRVHVDAAGEDDAHALTVPAPDPTSSRSTPTVRPRFTPIDPESLAPPSSGMTARGWALIWVLAALSGIAIGVWLSLRSQR